jgi:hypothetical protein
MVPLVPRQHEQRPRFRAPMSLGIGPLAPGLLRSECYMRSSGPDLWGWGGGGSGRGRPGVQLLREVEIQRNEKLNSLTIKCLCQIYFVAAGFDFPEQCPLCNTSAQI